MGSTRNEKAPTKHLQKGVGDGVVRRVSIYLSVKHLAIMDH